MAERVAEEQRVYENLVDYDNAVVENQSDSILTADIDVRKRQDENEDLRMKPETTERKQQTFSDKYEVPMQNRSKRGIISYEENTADEKDKDTWLNYNAEDYVSIIANNGEGEIYDDVDSAREYRRKDGRFAIDKENIELKYIKDEMIIPKREIEVKKSNAQLFRSISLVISILTILVAVAAILLIFLWKKNDAKCNCTNEISHLKASFKKMNDTINILLNWTYLQNKTSLT